jgi:hypothetical protein
MKLLSLLLAAMFVVLVLAVPALAGSVSKLTFDNVTYPDGTTGVIEASVKVVNKSGTTVCDYYSDNHVAFLGQYQQVGGFAATDPAQVEQFCLDNFANRT